MELYIGGYAQGKLSYVLQKKGLSQEDVICGGDFVWKEEQLSEKKIFDDFELWVHREVERGEKVEEKVEQLLKTNPTIIVVSDEVGNGVVPVEPMEREYRERLGRILCTLAQRADRMERILCGMGQRIK